MKKRKRHLLFHLINSEEKESEEITKVFYGLKILFAAYSPVFDEMLYDDENEESFASDKKTEEIELGGLDDGDDESIKTVHLYDIHPKAFDKIYDICLNAMDVGFSHPSFHATCFFPGKSDLP